MAGLIPEDHIRYILEKIDIVDVINAKIGLKKKGLNFFACCPFHKEKTPSFTVNPTKQFYYCFGCGASGDVVKFIMDFESLSFIEVVTNLTHSLGLELPNKNNLSSGLSELANVLELAAKFFELSLRDHNLSLSAINYLKSRKISGKMAKNYRLGFAPSSWDSLKKFLITKNISENIAFNAGLLSKNANNQRSFDKFRNRIMFAIRDKYGQVIGFGGRVLSPEDEPKYLNSPETHLFSKGHELYGLFEAKQAIRAQRKAIVVEGYLDVISLSQFGVSNCVATLGTSCSEHHIEKLFKITNEIVFCFDGDQAGRKASIKALELVLPLLNMHKEIKFLILEPNEDPDSFIHQYGVERFKQKVNSAFTTFDFIKESSCWSTNPHTLEGKIILTKRAKELILLIRDQLLSQMMLNQLAQELGVENQLLSATNQKAERFENMNTHYKRKASSKPSTVISLRSPVKKLLAMIIKFPAFNAQLPSLEDKHLFNNEVKLLYIVKNILIREPELSVTQLKERLPANLIAFFDINELSLISSNLPADGAMHEFAGCVKLMQRMITEQQVELLLNKAKNEELTEEDKIFLQKLLLEQ